MTNRRLGTTWKSEPRSSGKPLFNSADVLQEIRSSSHCSHNSFEPQQSVRANYCEADDSGSKKEFRFRISLCKRESKETKHWLRMMAAAVPELKEEARKLWTEAKELNLIFGSIFRK